MPSTVAERINTIRRRAGKTVSTLGDAGAFGIAGSAATHLIDPALGSKITEIQKVYDTFGGEATTNLLASQAAITALKRLPPRAKDLVRSGARGVLKASPLVHGVVNLARTVARSL